MNIQPGNSKTPKRRVPSHSETGGGFDALCSLFARIGQVTLFVFLFGALFHTYIKLDQEINGAEAGIRRINEECAEIDRDIAMLKTRRDDSSTLPFIQQQIARFGLDLHYVTQDKQQDIRLYTNAQLARLKRYYTAESRLIVDNSSRRAQMGIR